MNLRPLMALAAFGFLAVAYPPLEADDKEKTKGQPVSYYNQIRPIFQAKCQGCHQPAKRGGEYVMTDFAAMLKGGDTGSKACSKGLRTPGCMCEGALGLRLLGGAGARPRG